MRARPRKRRRLDLRRQPLRRRRKIIPAWIENLIQQANQHYEKAQQDLRQGDWSGYGQEIQKLGEILKQMRRRISNDVFESAGCNDSRRIELCSRYV